MEPKKNKLIDFLSFSEEVQTAIKEKKPILALESTVITHGLPSPTNLVVATELEDLARSYGVTPATIAILNGKIKIGLTTDEMAILVSSPSEKASVRDLAYVVSQKKSAGTTVALTTHLAHLANIFFFATGGIGGVHRGDDFDISADLLEISKTPITIISAGPKAILDISRTLEVLETYSVPVIGYQTKKIPAFYSTGSKHYAPIFIEQLEDLINLVMTHRQLQMPSGILIMNPIPETHEIPAAIIEPMIESALQQAALSNMRGKEITPFLLQILSQLTSGSSLQANIALLKNNVQLGAMLAALYNQTSEIYF